MRNSYTRGPWLVGRNDGFSVPINASHELAFDLATVNHGGNDSEALANAKLIAAAPDMLTVLRDLEWTGLNDGRGVTHAMCPACSALKSRGSGHNPHCGLAAAIAKAEDR